MKKLKLLWIACLCMAVSTGLWAQTVEDIISKNLQAIGGKDVLAKITSVHLEGNSTVMGNDYPMQNTLLIGKGFRSQTTVNGSDIIQVITDHSGWTINPLAGQTKATALPDEIVSKSKASLSLSGDLYDSKEKGYTDSLLGQVTINNVNAYKVKISKPGTSVIYFIDPTTYYVLKTESTTTINGNEMTAVITYSNYKKTDVGYVFPYTMGVTNMGYDITVNYSKVDFNVPVDTKIFDMPN